MTEETRVCYVDGCEGKVFSGGLCSRHYKQMRMNNAITKVEAPIRATVCTVEGCDKPVYARGMCNAHYRQYNRKKEKGTLDEGEKICKVKNCNEPVRCSGLCKAHYARAVYITKKKREEKEKLEQSQGV